MSTSRPVFDLPAIERLLDLARRDTWTLKDLELGGPVRPMPRLDEEAVVQYLTDFIYIERMAGAFFQALAEKFDEPSVVELLGRFVDDEIRHAQAMQLLADRFDVHHYRIYAANSHLVSLITRLAEWIRLAPPDAAAAAVAVGEIVFDIAYLRPVDEFLSDPVASAVLRRVHRDESRHIALDYQLLETFGRPDYRAEPATLNQRLALSAAFARAFVAGVPFMREVFFGQSAHVDPDGQRLNDAVHRIQLLIHRGHLSERGFSRIYLACQRVFDSPLAGPWARSLAGALLNADPDMFRTRVTAAERARFAASTPEDAARETVRAFTAP